MLPTLMGHENAQSFGLAEVLGRGLSLASLVTLDFITEKKKSVQFTTQKKFVSQFGIKTGCDIVLPGRRLQVTVETNGIDVKKETSSGPVFLTRASVILTVCVCFVCAKCANDIST